MLRASVLVARQSPGNAVRTLMEVGANTLQVKLKLIRVVILKLETDEANTKERRRVLIPKTNFETHTSLMAP